MKQHDGRKAKYSVNMLKEDLVEAAEDVNNPLSSSLGSSTVVNYETNTSHESGEVEKMEKLNLLDVAVCRPLKGKQARELNALLVSTSACLVLTM